MRRKTRRAKRLLKSQRKAAYILKSFVKSYRNAKNHEQLTKCLKDQTITDEALYSMIKEKLDNEKL